jgi:ribosomal protein S18 acetylase RimI-like enzyme
MDPPFADPFYTVGSLELRDLAGTEADLLADRIAAIDPWHRLGYTPGNLRPYFARREAGARRLIFLEGDQIVGAAVIRYPWLHGPYIELLALFPEAQGRGHGGTIIEWLATRAATEAANLWVATSEVNDRALAFYWRHGFEPIGRLEDLVRDGDCELLLRKRLNKAASH